MGPYDHVRGGNDVAVTEARCRRNTSGIEIVGILVGLTMLVTRRGAVQSSRLPPIVREPVFEAGKASFACASLGVVDRPSEELLERPVCFADCVSSLLLTKRAVGDCHGYVIPAGGVTE